MHDHAPLKAAALAATRDGGEVLPLFILESDQAPTAFLIESLRDLEGALELRGAALHYRRGDPMAVLSELHRAHGILSLHVHETTQAISADQGLESWAMRAGVPLRTYPQFGPEPQSSDMSWSGASWDGFMAAPRHEAPSALPAAQVGFGQRPVADSTVATDQGGRRAAIAQLRAVLGRVSDLGQVATPEAPAPSYYDQLAPYLEAGVLSVRETWQAAVTARNQYLSAGQEIRAARVTALIRQLPDLYRARYGAPSRPGRQAQAAGGAARSQDPQLSLDLGPTGTG